MDKTKHHPLKVWLFEHGDETQASFAKRAGMTQAHVSDIINGKTKPSLDTMRRIAAATNGEVMANDFQEFVPAATGDRA
jgi:transcriptional regulator with XRE-family HTH domain